MRVPLGGTLDHASDDHHHVPETGRVIEGVRLHRHRRLAHQAGYAVLGVALVVGVAWWRPSLDFEDHGASRTSVTLPAAYPRVPDDLDFSPDGTLDVPLAVVRSRCELTVDEHIRPVDATAVWDASTVPGGSDIIIARDAGPTRHCLVGYNTAPRETFINWANVTPVEAAQACADRVGLDAGRWGPPLASVLRTPNDFSGPSAVVALRRGELLAECYLARDRPAARLAVSRLATLNAPLCAGVSLYYTTSDTDHRVADGVMAWGIAPVRDASGALLEDAAFVTFTGSGLPFIAVPVEQGILAANVSWPVRPATSLADRHPSTRLVSDYTVTVIARGGRMLAFEYCG